MSGEQSKSLARTDCDIPTMIIQSTVLLRLPTNLSEQILGKSSRSRSLPSAAATDRLWQCCCVPSDELEDEPSYAVQSLVAERRTFCCCMEANDPRLINLHRSVVRKMEGSTT